VGKQADEQLGLVDDVPEPGLGSALGKLVEVSVVFLFGHE
jgi:hypothetical protein